MVQNVKRECSWRLFNPKTVDFIGDISKDMHEQVRRMLRLGNVAPVECLTETFFPRDEIKGHSSGTHSGTTWENFYRNKTILDMVLHMYRDDYKAFSLATPKWGGHKHKSG